MLVLLDVGSFSVTCKIIHQYFSYGYSVFFISVCILSFKIVDIIDALSTFQPKMIPIRIIYCATNEIIH